MAWSPFRQPVNKALISGYWTPGILRQPRGAKIVRNLDERNGYGIDFAFLVFTGRKLGHFSTEIMLVTEKDWQDYAQFSALIHAVPRRGAVQQTSNGYNAARAMTIWHPQLVPLEITQCVVEAEYQVDIDEDMIGHWPIDFVQVKATPQAGFARPEAPAPAKADTPDEAEFRRLKDTLASKRQSNNAAGR